ncbi:MAG: sodium-dependent transporter [bacterium]|nr:sodium-dependent transporter [bacterium]
MEQTKSTRSHWKTRMGFMLATAGSAVGLGNIWKFPYITAMNGGGAFVLTFLLCIVFVGLPLLIAEFYIGSKAQSNVVKAFEVTDKPKTPWRIAGMLALFSAFIILSYYSVVGGWVLDFLYLSITNQFSGHNDQEIKMFFDELFQSGGRQVFWHFIFMGLVVSVIVGGIQQGIERWSVILMPILFAILIALFVYACFMPGIGQSFNFMFAPDTSKLKPACILEAVGHAFFSLSIGVGCMITYGSYLDNRKDLIKTAVAIAIVDTLLALVMGLTLFSVIFSFGIDIVDAGPTLLFQTLPRLFVKMTGGYLIAIAFFTLVTFAALTSAMSLLEVFVSFCTETFGGTRKFVTILSGFIMFLVGILAALSSNILSHIQILNMSIFSFLDKSTSSVTMPLAGLIGSLFFGWILGRKALLDISQESSTAKWVLFSLLWLTRIVAPLAILVLMINGLRDW